MTDQRRSRSSGCALLASALLVGTVVLGMAAPASAEDATVAATGSNTFTPSRVAVLVGDSVTWSTTGGVNHTVTSSSANWRKDSEIALVGQSTSFTFSRAGTYAYYCRTHGSPTTGMRGTVVVSGPTAASPSPTRTTASPRPTPKPSASASPTARPTPSRTPSARPSARPTPSRTPSATPTPARTGTAAAIGIPTSVPTPVRTSAVPLPTVADSASPDALVDLGSGGLGPRPSTGRGRGLPTFLALVALGGVVSAQIRALLNLPPAD